MNTQLPLFGNYSYQKQDDVRNAIEIANAAGMSAAISTECDNCTGTVKITLNTELNEVTLRLVQNLTSEGWIRTDRGAEWKVTLPPELFAQDAFAPALAYARAFKDTLRCELSPERMTFKMESKSTSY
jgi:hypothetical protein